MVARLDWHRSLILDPNQAFERLKIEFSSENSSAKASLLTPQLSIEHSRCVMLRAVAASMQLVDSATTLRSAQNDNT